MKYWWIILIVVTAYAVGQAVFTLYLFNKSKELFKVSYAGQTEHGNKSEPILNVLLAGDSISAGVGSTSFENSLSGRLANGLASDYHVVFTNAAKSGNKMVDLLNTSLPEKSQNLTIIFIGSNDLFHFTSLKKFEQATSAVLEKYSKISDKLILIGPADVGGTTAIPPFLKPVYANRWPKYATIMKDVSAKYSNVQYINPIDYKGKLKEYGNTEAKDGFHPNDNGHKYWSDIILSIVS